VLSGLIGRSLSVGSRDYGSLACVQSLRRRSSVNTTCTFAINHCVRSRVPIGTKLTDSLKMLNIPYLPSSCILNHNLGAREMHTHSCLLLSFSEEPTTSRSSIDGSRLCSDRDTVSITSSHSPSIYQEEEDEDEQKRQEIWSVGPVPAATFTFAAYANDSEVIKKLVEVGVDLSKLERKKEVIPFILKLNFEQQVVPCIE